MAVSVDTRTNGPVTTGALTVSWNHTVTAGNILLVDANQFNGASIGGRGATGAQWNTRGTPETMTQVGPRVDGTDIFIATNIYYLLAPSAGTKQITITNVQATDRTQCGSASYKNVDQTSPFNAASPQGAAGASGTVPSLTVTSAVGEMVHDTVVYDQIGAGGVPVPGAGQTLVSGGDSGLNEHAGASSDKPGAATVTMTWTHPVNTYPWAQDAVSMTAGLIPPARPFLGSLFVGPIGFRR